MALGGKSESNHYECRNCGSFVSRDYVRVFVPEGLEDARVCPHCEDAIREGAEVREARARRVSSSP